MTLNKPCSRRQLTLNDDLLDENLVSDLRPNTRDVAQKFNVLCSTIHEHLKINWENF